MILLDTDHLSVLRHREGERADRLARRIALSPDPVIGTTIVNVEETMRGWMATIAKERQPRRQVTSYRDLAGIFEFFTGYHIALFDEIAVDIFLGFSAIQIGTSDRKIAAIAISQGALLLTANRRDFERIPALRFANWLDA